MIVGDSIIGSIEFQSMIRSNFNLHSIDESIDIQSTNQSITNRLAVDQSSHLLMWPATKTPWHYVEDLLIDAIRHLPCEYTGIHFEALMAARGSRPSDRVRFLASMPEYIRNHCLSCCLVEMQAKMSWESSRIDGWAGSWLTLGNDEKKLLHHCRSFQFAEALRQ